jgi:hypothetical protein
MHAAQRQTSSIQTTKSDSSRYCTTLRRRSEPCIMAKGCLGVEIDTSHAAARSHLPRPKLTCARSSMKARQHLACAAHEIIYEIMHQRSDTSQQREICVLLRSDLIARRNSTGSLAMPAAAKATATATPIATGGLAPIPTAATAP